MLDFNHRPSFSEQVTECIDFALQVEHSKQKPRSYLGGSRLGVPCERALQYEHLNVLVDEGKELSGKIIRIFAAGHVFEDLAVSWLRLAGFELYTHTSNGEQYGFSVVDGRLQGHIDGVIAKAPEHLKLDYPIKPDCPVKLGYPALWECKSLNAASWKDTVKKGLTLSKPVYAAQIALYQAYMEEQIPGICKAPALFTAINKNTAELYFELIPFDGQLAQRASDKGVRVICASDAKELLPRMTRDATNYQCKFCQWQERCWSNGAYL